MFVLRLKLLLRLMLMSLPPIRNPSRRPKGAHHTYANARQPTRVVTAGG
jgi:hypothetical protein